MRWVAVALFVLAAAIAFAGYWIGSGVREQACVAKTEAQFPIAFSEKGSGGYDTEPAFQVRGANEMREGQLAGC